MCELTVWLFSLWCTEAPLTVPIKIRCERAPVTGDTGSLSHSLQPEETSKSRLGDMTVAKRLLHNL